MHRKKMHFCAEDEKGTSEGKKINEMSAVWKLISSV